MEKVEKLYKAWFTGWRDTVVPKIMFQPKWYNSEKDLQEGDLVCFQKKEGKVEQPWTVGRVEQVVRSDRDDAIRRVVVKYQNPMKIILSLKLWNIDEHQVQEDLDELEKKINLINRRPTNIDDIAFDDDNDSSDGSENDDNIVISCTEW